MSKEYTYDIDKYTIGVDENGEDGIGMTIAIIKNGEINFLGNCYGENARCIDLLIKENQELKEQLDKYENPEDMTLMMMWCTEKVKDENQDLKKQLEDKEDYINKLQATKDKLDKWDYENTMQQKEFIKYLEDEIKDVERPIELLSDTRDSRIPILKYKKHILEVIFAKYKEIIGENKDEK